MWVFQLHDTITGNFLARVDPSGGSWRKAFGRGSGQHEFQLRSLGHWAGENAKNVTAPNARTLVVLWGDTVMYAGMITRTVYDRGSGVLTVHHIEGVRFHFKNRLTFGIGTYDDIVNGVPVGDLRVVNRGAEGAVRAILKYGIGSDGRGGPEWQLPIDLPADSPGSLSYEWRYYEIHRIEDLLAQVEAEGYEIDFEPYMTSAGQLRYRTRVGDPIVEEMLVLPVSVGQSLVSDLTVTVDGTEQLTGVFYAGKGSEADMRWGDAGFVPGPVIPVRDASRSAKDVDDVAQLTRMAMADLVANRVPVVQWDFGVTNEMSGENWVFDFGVLRHGLQVFLDVRGDDFVDDGQHGLRIIGLSGDMSFTVKPEVVPL